MCSCWLFTASTQSEIDFGFSISTRRYYAIREEDWDNREVLASRFLFQSFARVSRPFFAATSYALQQNNTLTQNHAPSCSQ